jgi:hypothetical protein
LLALAVIAAVGITIFLVADIDSAQQLLNMLLSS